MCNICEKIPVFLKAVCERLKEDFKAFGELLLYAAFAAVIVFMALLIGPLIFKIVNSFVNSLVSIACISNFISNYLPVYNVSNYSVEASDAVSYYLQALLAVVIAIKFNKNN